MAGDAAIPKTDERPPGWRAEWRAPKPRRAGGKPHPPVALARARGALDAPHMELPELPSGAEDLAALAKRVLLDIAVNGGGPDAGARVGAAKALLEATAESPVTVLVRLLGDEAKAVAWMRTVLPALEARADAKARDLPEFDRTCP